MLDPKWLEILKSSGGQAFALASACGLFILSSRLGVVEVVSWVWATIFFVFLLSSSLALVALITQTLSILPVHKLAVEYVNTRGRKKAVEKYIPHMTQREQNVLGYLLKHNQRVFTAAADGGYAVTLISSGLVVRNMRPGQQASMDDVPFAVPDHVWDVLVQHKDKIAYQPNMRRGTEIYPWRVPSGF